MDLRCSWRQSSSPRVWLALGALALALGEAAGASKDPAGDESHHAAQSGRGDWCARVCGGGGGQADRDAAFGRCPDPCPRCAPPPACPPCPAPVCPPPPPIPPCPQPLVNLTCPDCQPRPRGYQRLPNDTSGSYYKIYKTLATWDEAKTVCFNEGAHLAIPKSQNEGEILKSLMKKEEVHLVYVGFHDNYNDGQYLTVLGDPMSDEQKKMWETNQPQGGLAENCALFPRIGKMHDYPCSSRFNFVCQMRY